MAEQDKWAEAQVNALVEAGVNLPDAQKAVQWVLDNLPPGYEPDVWIPTADDLYEDPSTPENVQDARADWYAKDAIPAKFKRLLDAREE